MGSITYISRTDIENNFTPEKARISKIIYFAMFMGVLLFIFFSFFFYWQKKKDLIGSSDLESTLILYGYITFIIFIFAIILAYILPKLVFSSNRLKRSINSQKNKDTLTLVDHLISQIRVFLILRVVPLEAAALMGVVGLFLAITDGVIYSNTNYWYFLIPAILFLIYIILNFPTKKTQIDLIEKHFLNELIKNYS